MGDGQPGGDGGQVQRLADEITQRNHQCMQVYRPALGHFVGGMGGKLDLFVGAKQQDIR